MLNPMTNNFVNSFGGMMNMMQQFNQFKNTIQGNPQQQVQNLLNSGQMSQNQYMQIMQMAQQLSQIMPK